LPRFAKLYFHFFKGGLRESVFGPTV